MKCNTVASPETWQVQSGSQAQSSNNVPTYADNSKSQSYVLARRSHLGQVCISRRKTSTHTRVRTHTQSLCLIVTQFTLARSSAVDSRSFDTIFLHQV